MDNAAVVFGVAFTALTIVGAFVASDGHHRDLGLWIVVTGFIAGVLACGCWYQNRLWTKDAAKEPPKSRIQVRPHSIELIPNHGDRKTVATIYNQSNEVLYQIWLKATLTGAAQSDDVVFSPQVPANSLEFRVGGCIFSAQWYGVKGRDAASTTAFYFRLYQLDPHSTFKFTVSDRTKDDRRGRLDFSLIYWSDAPPQQLEEPARAVLFLQPPEDCTIDGFGFYYVGNSDV